MPNVMPNVRCPLQAVYSLNHLLVTKYVVDGTNHVVDGTNQRGSLAYLKSRKFSEGLVKGNERDACRR